MPIPPMPDRFDDMVSRLAAEATTWPPRPDIIASWLRQAAQAERKACAEVARTTELPSRHVAAPGNVIAAAILARTI